MAKFEKYKMREKVNFEGWKRIKEMKELKSNPVPGLNVPVDPKFANFGIGEQFPTEIYKTRKELLPICRRALAKKQNAKLIVDKQYINGKPYNPEKNEHMMTDSAWASHGVPCKDPEHDMNKNLPAPVATKLNSNISILSPNVGGLMTKIHNSRISRPCQ